MPPDRRAVTSPAFPTAVQACVGIRDYSSSPHQSEKSLTLHKSSVVWKHGHWPGVVPSSTGVRSPTGAPAPAAGPPEPPPCASGGSSPAVDGWPGEHWGWWDVAYVFGVSADGARPPVLDVTHDDVAGGASRLRREIHERSVRLRAFADQSYPQRDLLSNQVAPIGSSACMCTSTTPGTEGSSLNKAPQATS